MLPVFQVGNLSIRVEAAIGGQQFTYQAK